MIKKCYAKLNLTLDNLYQREDGYHEIDTIMVRISLHDILIIEKNSLNKIRIFTDSKELENIKDNLVYKAWEILKDQTRDCGVDIKLIKNIPFSAGLAGGSTDCAETMKALNELWNLNLTKKELMDKAKLLGADVPFFFVEKSARARGIGEKLTEIEINCPYKFLLINDGTEISSAFIYSRLKDYGFIETNYIIDELRKSNTDIYKYFFNVMEEVAFQKFPHLKEIKKDLTDNKALTALMSGSGSTIFGVFDNQNDLDFAYKNLKEKYKFVEKVSLVDD